MLARIFVPLLLSASSAMAAAHPFAPYFGVWTGTGMAGDIESNLTVTFKPMGQMLSGNFNARPKRPGKSHSGIFRGTPQQDGCFMVNVKVMGQPQAFDANACVQQDGSVAVQSAMPGLASGTITPQDDFKRCTFQFNSLMGQASGALVKKGGAASKKAKGKKKRRAKRPVSAE